MINGSTKFLLICIVSALLVSVILTFSGCIETRYIPVVETRDSIVYRNKIDSLTIYAHDSIFIHEKGDTVWYEKYRILYRDKVVVDTVYNTKSERVEIPVEVKIPERYIPKWVWWLLSAFILLIAGIGIRIYLKIRYKK